MILVTGASGFLGSNVCQKLDEQKKKYIKTSLNLGTDLRDKQQTLKLFETAKPEYVINCAAYVGGIQFGYKHPADLFVNNLEMAINLLEACCKFGIKRVVNPIGNCSYPAKATFFKEEEFWDGPMHESVLSFGFAKKAFWVGSWSFAAQYGLDAINLVLSNMYGPGDSFDEEKSHALGALIMKFVKAKKYDEPAVIVWGTGKPVREWLYVDDGAEALIRALYIAPHMEPINIGVGKGISVIDLAEMIKESVGYKGRIQLDLSKPDGAPYKTVDGSKGERLLGWKPSIDLKDGIRRTVEWFIVNKEKDL